VDVNDTMLKMFECTYDEALGLNIGDISYGQHDQEAAKQVLEKVLEKYYL